MIMFLKKQKFIINNMNRMEKEVCQVGRNNF